MDHQSFSSRRIEDMPRAQLEKFADKIDILVPQDMDTEELRSYLQRRAQRIPKRILRSVLSSMKTLPRARTGFENLSFNEVLQKLRLYGISTAGITTRQEALSAASRALLSSLSSSRAPSSLVNPTFTVDFNLLENLPTETDVDWTTTEPPVNILQGASKCKPSQAKHDDSVNCLYFAMTSSKETLLRTLSWKDVHKDATFDDLVQCYLWIRSIGDKKVVSSSRFSDILCSSKEQLRQNIKSSKQQFVSLVNESAKLGCTSESCANFVGWTLDLRMQESVIDRMDWAVLVLICAYARVPRVVNIEEFTRYQRLSNVGGEYLYKLTEAVYPEYFSNKALLTPARYLALRTPSFLEDELPCCSLDTIGKEEILDIAPRIGMEIPEDQDPVQYFWRELSEYRDVEINRKEPPNLFTRNGPECPQEPLSMDNALEILSRYPDSALRRFACFRDSCNTLTRQELLRQAYSVLTSTNKTITWQVTTSGVQWIQGTQVQHFRFEELSNAFREANAFVSPDTGEEFAVESMSRLLEALNNEESKSVEQRNLAFIVRDLLSKNVQRQEVMQEFATWFPTLSERQKKASIDFVGWLFRLGMYCRCWKGPGMPYPSHSRFGACAGTPTCNQRGERQKNVSECLRQRYFYETGLPEAMTAIPVLRYDFVTGNATKGEELFRFLDALEEGEKKLILASNRLIETSYFFLRYVARLSPREVQEAIQDPQQEVQFQPRFNPAEYIRLY
jgi:hypothetical protein